MPQLSFQLYLPDETGMLPNVAGAASMMAAVPLLPNVMLEGLQQHLQSQHEKICVDESHSRTSAGQALKIARDTPWTAG